MEPLEKSSENFFQFNPVNETVAVLNHNIDEAIRLLASIEALPQAKIYEDSSGAVRASAQSIVTRIDQWKVDNPSLFGRIRNAPLNFASWGAQAVQRWFAGVDHQAAAKALENMSKKIQVALENIDLIVESEELPLELSDYQSIRERVAELNKHVSSPGLEEGLKRIVRAYGAKDDELKKKQDSPKEEVPTSEDTPKEAPTAAPSSSNEASTTQPSPLEKGRAKIETMMKVVAPFQKNLNEHVSKSLVLLDKKIRQVSAPPAASVEPMPQEIKHVEESVLVSTTVLVEPPSQEVEKDVLGSPREMEESETQSSEETLTERSSKTPSPEPSPSPDLPGIVVREDLTQDVEIKPPAADQVETKQVLKAFNFSGVNLKDILEKLSPKGCFAFMEVANNYWMHEKYGDDLFKRNDPRVLRLAPMRFNNKTLQEILSRMDVNQLRKLKDYVIKYYYTFAIRR